MPLLAAGYLTAKPGQHGTPESGRSNHPLILYDIARSHRCTVSKCLHHSQTASSVVTQDRHPQPVLEARHRVRAKPLLCKNSIRCLLNFTWKPATRPCGSFRLQLRPLRLSRRKTAASSAEAACFSMASHWPPRKKTPERESNRRLSVVHHGNNFFLADGWSCELVPKRLPDARPTNEGAILRPNKKRHSSATSRFFRGWAVQKPETRHTKAPYFGICRDCSAVLLTRLWRRPIIGLFWQPSRSLPSDSYSSDGRGTDDHFS